MDFTRVDFQIQTLQNLSLILSTGYSCMQVLNI